MAPLSEIEALFTDRLPDARARWPRQGGPLAATLAAVGCAMAAALVLTALVCAFFIWSDGPARVRAIAPYALLTVVAAVGVSVPLFRRAAAHARAIDEVVRVFAAPLIQLLLPGWTVDHRAAVDREEWKRTLLFPKRLPRTRICARLSGRLADVPVVLDELDLDWGSSDSTDHTWRGWVARVTLPFEVAGHVRVRALRPDALRQVSPAGFAVDHAATARFDATHVVEIATGQPIADPAAVPPRALLTDGVVEGIRSRAGVELAASERTLWILFEDTSMVWAAPTAYGLDLDRWRRAHRDLVTLETLLRGLLAAAGSLRCPSLQLAGAMAS